MITKICDMKNSQQKPVFIEIPFLKIIAISRVQKNTTFVTDKQ